MGKSSSKEKRVYVDITYHIPIDMPVTWELNLDKILEGISEAFVSFSIEEIRLDAENIVKKRYIVLHKDLRLNITIDTVDGKSSYFKNKRYMLKKTGVKTRYISSSFVAGNESKKKLKVIYTKGKCIHDSDAESAKIQVWDSDSDDTITFTGFENNVFGNFSN